MGVTVATATSAAGVAINVATGPGGGAAGWGLVAACTAVLGVVTAVVDHVLSPPAPPVPPADPDRMAVPELVIELEIRPDGTRVHRATAHTERAARELARAGTPPLPRAPREHGEHGSRGGAEMPRPLPVALITRSRSAGIARRLEAVGGRYPDTGVLDVRVCVDDDPVQRRKALRSAAAVFLDDHCASAGDGAPLVGGLDLAGLRDAEREGPPVLLVVLGCRDGNDDRHADALRRSLDRPAAVLGCAGTVPLEHRTVLFPAVLDRLGPMAGTRVTAGDVREAVHEALACARRERPQMDWARWTVSVVHP
ncbi:hypothetical protein ACQP1W_31435 [Spirillospora sp. CA-255316]